MAADLLASLRRLSDSDLVARLRELAGRERGEVVLLIAHLAELDTRDFHLRAGHGSLFAYCRDALALSEQEAYSRIAAARAARRFPVVLEMLEAGVLNVTTVRLLAPRLTPENHRAALESARGKSKLQVEELAARLWPRPDVPSVVRKLPPPARVPSLPIAASVVPVSPAAAGSLVAAPAATSPPVPPWPAPRRSADIAPLSPDRYKVQVTISGQTLEKLQRAKDLLRHAIPSGDEAAILDRALTALLASLAQKRFAATEKPRASAGTAAGSRHIPAEVKREVWRRDLGRCAFVGTGGRRCGERAFLEFHHVRPFAMGGEATVKNIQLRCRSHNDYEARVCFGPAHALTPSDARPRSPEVAPSGVRGSHPFPRSNKVGGSGSK
jgi:hypothetical protein